MILGYADPPYIGCSEKHYATHPDYDGEVDHYELLRQLEAGYDGWILHASVPSLPQIYHYLSRMQITDYRLIAWVKPWAAFKRNVPVAYAWEPVFVKAVRKPVVDPDNDFISRDWIAEGMTMKRGLTGAKPARLCQYLFAVAGLERTDELVDLFPGSGAVKQAWKDWTAQYAAAGTLFE